MTTLDALQRVGLCDIEEHLLVLLFCHKLVCKFSFNFMSHPKEVGLITVCLSWRHRLLSKRMHKPLVSGGVGLQAQTV